MPKAESPKHSKSPADQARPVSPHRVAIPPTPAAATRSNPIDGPKTRPSTSPKKSLEKDQETAPSAPVPASGKARAASEAPVAKPEPSSTTTAVESAQPAAGNKDAEISDKPIDMEIFSQILELDEDDEEHAFSKLLVSEYFQQVDTTFADMERQLQKNDLEELSKLGHFLKGSSAALGVWRVQNTCEIIQHVGHLRLPKDKYANVMEPLTKEQASEKLRALKKQAEGEFEQAKKWLNDYYPGGVGEAE